MRGSIVKAALSAALLGGVFTGSALAADNDEAKNRDLTVVQRPVADLQPSHPGSFGLKAWLDHANGRYHIGDKVRLAVKADREGYITVVDVGTSGAVTVLFPNANDQDNQIAAGEVVHLGRHGWSIEAGGPRGVEVIKVFMSSSPKAAYTPDGYHSVGPFKSANANSSDAARDLSVVLDHNGEWTAITKLMRITGHE